MPTGPMSQIRCDSVALAGFGTPRQAVWFGQDVPPDDQADDEDLDRVFWANYWDCRCCSYPDSSGDLRSVIMPRGFYSARQWHSTGMYTDYFGPFGIEHETGFVFPAGPGPAAGPGQTVRLLFFRGPGKATYPHRRATSTARPEDQ